MRRTILIITFLGSCFFSKAQVVGLDSIFHLIKANNPGLRMYDADIRSMDAAAKGAGSWMPPEAGAGLYMTPYDTRMWKGDGAGQPGMGQFMITVQQMFPNPAWQHAESEYMKAMSTVEKDRKNYALNEMYAEAKKNYYEWMMDKKKLVLLKEDEKLLNFMIENAELRYRNGMEKISA